MDFAEGERCVIWVDTIKGEAKGAGGNAFTHKARAEERIKILLDDVFQQSFQAMASAQPIKDFSTRKSKGIALYLRPFCQNNHTEPKQCFVRSLVAAHHRAAP
jgi:hypothetical protein